MAHTVHVERLFSNIVIRVPGRRIAEQALLKIEEVKRAITERESRISALCEEHRLGAADLFALAQQEAEPEYGRPAAYRAATVKLPAGVASGRMRESEQIESERAQVRTLGLLARNLAPDVAHELSFAELEFLGF